MAKVADLYYQLDPWKIAEKGFDKNRSEVSEAIFALGNEYMGVRGYFEEGFSGATLLGSYFNGIYENSPEENRVQYKGIVKRSHFMVNAVDWLKTEIIIDGQRLDLNRVAVRDYYRELDLRSGILTRSFQITTGTDKEVFFKFERFLDMEQAQWGYQKISVCTKAENVELELTLGADFNSEHVSQGQNFWREIKKDTVGETTGILGETLTTKQKVFSGFYLKNNQSLSSEVVTRDKFIGRKFNVKLSRDNCFEVEKHVNNIVSKTPIATEKLWQKGIRDSQRQQQISYEQTKINQKVYWKKVWEKYDITINGDELNQQGIRFCIFQLQQTYHGQNKTNNIGAKGLTGESYGGLAFWDTETCCLPFYLLNNLDAAKNLLEFRYETLSQARLRATELDCKGACYPIATLNGHEASDLWQHASLQFQPSTGVAYGIFHYMNLSDDTEFLYGHGIEMLIEICRFLASRGDFSPTGEFGFFGVMGPDEFQMMVNHNGYTNYMAKKTFEYTLQTLSEIARVKPERKIELISELQLTQEEQELWKLCADKTLMLIREDGVIEQHDGFFKLPHLDIQEIPIEDFPLYHHWSYDRIYRNDMIKQPDVLMFQFLYNQDFSFESKKVNYEFYEPKTIHESSLSPSIHSILAAELGKNEAAYEFFGFATRMDLDNYNRNTREGLHTTSIAAAWMNIVYGFGGVRTDGPILQLNPTIPENWHDYEFKFTYKNALIAVKVSQKFVSLTKITGHDITISLYDKAVILNDEVYEIKRNY